MELKIYRELCDGTGDWGTVKLDPGAAVRCNLNTVGCDWGTKNICYETQQYHCRTIFNKYVPLIAKDHCGALISLAPQPTADKFSKKMSRGIWGKLWELGWCWKL